MRGFRSWWLVLAAIGMISVSLSASAKTAEFRAVDYGAKGDGVTLDTAAIQKAIDAAALKGGTVVFRPGTYLTGSLFVKSRTTLRVDEGVVLLGSQHLSDYPVMQTRVAGIEMKWPAALINIYQQSKATITGRGIIDGDGKVFWNSYGVLRRDYEKKGLRWAADYDARRPRLIQIYKSSGVKLEGLTLKRSGFWTVHICYSTKVTVDGITIRNNDDGRGPSTDGIDIDSSSHVLVQHADISDNDDAICLKAGRDADGLRVNKPTEHIVVRDSTIREGAAGITIGSETSGGFRDIDVYRLHVISPVPNGILFKSAHTRGGWADGIRIHDLTLDGVGTVFAVNMNWNPSYSYAVLPPGVTNVPDYWKVLTEQVPHDQGLPHFRNVKIWNIKATGARRAFAVSAYPDAPLVNFHLKDLDIQARTAGSIADAKDWTFSGLRLQTADGSRLTVKDSSAVTGLPAQQAAQQAGQ